MFKMPPKQHPKPYRSSVRPYVEAILSMRRHKHMTWTEIAQKLKAEHGVAVHRSTVFRVYKRMRDGRDPLHLGATAEPARPAPRKTAIAAFAAEASNQSVVKHTAKECCAKRGITAEELLKPIPKGNAGPFAKWQQQQRQHKKKT
jgi:hypothetical protein